MGILNALTKLGCNHDWRWWENYDGSFVNAAVLANPDSRLRSCYEFRRCTKCKGLEARWAHNWREDQNSVSSQRAWERDHPHGSTDYQGPGIMLECTRCDKRSPQFVVMGD